MTNETILNYVQTERARGVADNAIADALLAQGWPVADVSSAMSGVVLSTAPAVSAQLTFKHLFEGRLMRWQYFTSSILFGFSLAIIIIILASVSGYFVDNMIVGYIGIGIIYLIAIPLSFSLTVRRLHDLDWNGWFLLLSFIPIVNFVFALVVLFKKGSDGANSYGPPQAERGFIDTLLNR